MKYAVYLASQGVPAPYGLDDDYFCVFGDTQSLKDQVNEFRSWGDEEDDVDELTDLHLGALLLGDPVTLKGSYLAICIRPFREE